MKSCKARPAFHISLPPRGLTLHDLRSAASTPGTPLPHTPMPFDMGDFTSIGIKRARDDDEMSMSSVSSWDGAADQDDPWQREELDVLDSILHNPLRPLSTAFPPSTLPPPQALDELTNQILTIAMNASPTRRKGTVSQEWPHSWSATRSRLFQIALKESKGLTLAESDGDGDGRPLWVKARPNIKRVGSMDFLEEAVEGDRGVCVRDQGKCEPLSFGEPLQALTNVNATPLKTPSASIPCMTLTPSSPVAPSPSPSRRSRPARPAYTRRPSLLQRGRSFTASDLASEDGHLDDEIVSSPSASIDPKPEQVTPTKRLTRSQSSMFPSHSTLSPKGLTKAFLAPHEPSTSDKAELCKPFELACASEEGSKRRKLKRLGSGFQITPVTLVPAPAGDGLSSPFEERRSLDF